MSQWLLAIIIVLIGAWYLTFTATRLDRLHHRVETSWANLDVFAEVSSAQVYTVASDLSRESLLVARTPRYTST